MARRACKVDANQSAIVDGLRAIGATVEVTSAVGGGFPDLVVGFRGACYLLEVKDGSKPPSQTKLTPDQVRWHAAWAGQKAVVYTLNHALEAIGAINQQPAKEAKGDRHDE